MVVAPLWDICSLPDECGIAKIERRIPENESFEHSCSRTIARSIRTSLSPRVRAGRNKISTGTLLRANFPLAATTGGGRARDSGRHGAMITTRLLATFHSGRIRSREARDTIARDSYARSGRVCSDALLLACPSAHLITSHIVSRNYSLTHETCGACELGHSCKTTCRRKRKRK